MSSKNAHHSQLWFSGIGEFRGGIQVYSEHFIRVFQQLQTNSTFDLLLRNNRKPPKQFLQEENTVAVFGRFPAALRVLLFSLKALLLSIFKRPDLIVAGHINFLPLATRLHTFFGIPYWVVTYGFESWNLDSTTISALKTADRIITISHYTRSRILERCPALEDRIEVIPCVVDTKRFTPAPKPETLLQRYDLTSEHKVILTVARLEGAGRKKGHEQLIAAVEQLAQTTPEIRYIIAGAGPDAGRLQSMARDLPVLFAGYVSDDELPDYYNLCDIYAMPSSLEGFGITYIEALSCGKPVIGAISSGAEDIVTSDQLGILVDPDQPGEITAAITTLFSQMNDNVRSGDSSSRRTHATNSFGIESFQERMKTVLERIADSPATLTVETDSTGKNSP